MVFLVIKGNHKQKLFGHVLQGEIFPPSSFQDVKSDTRTAVGGFVVASGLLVKGLGPR